jgi:glutaminyl-peptide cyclotransferase
MLTRRTGLLLGTMALAIVVVAGGFFLWGGADTLSAQTTCREPVPLRFEIASKIERSELGFTQGLEVRDGQLYESTGRIGGTTRINVISFDGQVRTLTDLGTTVFGEGLTILNDQIYQLTWQEHQVFVYDLAAKRQRVMRNPREGWGLTNDGTSLIFSDGGPSFYYVDPQTFAVRRTVKVRSTRPGDIVGLNELELVRGRLYGNIFTTWSIVRIDPASGCIDAVADMRGLRDQMSADEKAQIDSDSGNYVLNGIAHDGATGTFYVTGKRWKSIFSGRFVEGPR